jgi:chromosome segregation ATPase
MKRQLAGVFGAVLLGLAAVAQAQQTRDDGGSARLQAMVSQLTTEKTQLQAENKDAKTKLDAANAELKKLRDQNAALERRLGQTETSLSQSNATNTRSAAQTAQIQTRMDTLVAQFRETIETLRQTEVERNQLRDKLAARESTLAQCVTNNDKLFDTGVEILGRYEEKGCFSSLRENEPFTQNKRVQLQNLVDEYRWKLEDEKLPEASRDAAAAPGVGESGGS